MPRLIPKCPQLKRDANELLGRFSRAVSLSVPKVELSGAKATVLMGSRDGFKADKTGDQKEEGSPQGRGVSPAGLLNHPQDGTCPHGEPHPSKLP